MITDLRQKIITDFFNELFGSKLFQQFVSRRSVANPEEKAQAINEVIQEIAEYATVVPDFSQSTIVEFIKIGAIDANLEQSEVSYYKYQFCRFIIEQYLSLSQWEGCMIRIDNIIEHLKLGKELRIAKEIGSASLFNVDKDVKSVLLDDFLQRKTDWLASDFAYGFMLLAKQCESIYIEYQRCDASRYREGNKYKSAKSVFQKLAESYSQNYSNLHAVRAYQSAKKMNDAHAIESMTYCDELDYPMYFPVRFSA